MRLLDTNIFVRYLTEDHPTRSPACRRLFELIERGEEVVWTTDVAIAEVVFVLSGPRRYAMGRAEIRDGLLPLIELPGLKVAGKRFYRRAFDLFVAHPIDFADAYHAALIERRDVNELFSYDGDFDRIPSVNRFEPAESESHDQKV